MKSADRISERIKKQVEQLSARVVEAERSAEKQIRGVIQKSEKARREQLKKIKKLVSDAKKTKARTIIRQAESLKNDLESKTESGIKLVLKKLNVPSRDEIQRLQKRIRNLEQQLAEREKSEKNSDSLEETSAS